MGEKEIHELVASPAKDRYNSSETKTIDIEPACSPGMVTTNKNPINDIRGQNREFSASSINSASSTSNDDSIEVKEDIFVRDVASERCQNSRPAMVSSFSTSTMTTSTSSPACSKNHAERHHGRLKRQVTLMTMDDGSTVSNKIERPPLVKSMSVLMKGRFNAFCEAATIHGLGNIRRADNMVTKLSWGAVVLVQAGLLVYVFMTYINSYLNYYVEKGSTELSWEEQTAVELPDVTICASSPFKRSAISADLNVNSTFMAYLLMGFGAGAYVRQDFSNKTESHAAMKKWFDDVLRKKNTTYKGLIMDMALTCEDVILQCSYDGRELSKEDCCKNLFPKPTITSHGPCLSTHGNIQYQKIFGKKGGLTLVLKTDDYGQDVLGKYFSGLDSQLLTDAGDIYGYSVTVTHPITVPSTLTTTANKGAPAGMKISMELTKTVEDWSGLVVPQYRQKPKVCVDLSANANVMDYSEIMKEYAEWRGNCLLTKLFELSQTSCGCRLIDDPRIDASVRICEPDDILRCSLPQLYEDPTQLPTMFEMLKISGKGAATFSDSCLPLCRETRYRSTMSYELLSKKFINEMRRIHGLHEEDEILIIKLFFTDTNYSTIVHKAYTLLDCFGTIGGYMGLLLGASVISVVETCFFLVRFLYEFLMLYWSRVPWSISVQTPKLRKAFTLP